jgi:hypothetical protein
MKISRKIQEEKDIQTLIFDNPWLLDLNFERIVSRTLNNGWEVELPFGNRIDVLLKHRIDNRPIIVEFKKGDFYRENIGQLLSYKAAILQEFSNPDSELIEIFGNLITSPILCLVVKNCDDFSRSACHISGINVYEYKNDLKSLNVSASNLIKIENILHDDVIPLSYDRSKNIEQIYQRMHKVIMSMGLNESWKEYTRPHVNTMTL